MTCPGCHRAQRLVRLEEENLAGACVWAIKACGRCIERFVRGKVTDP